MITRQRVAILLAEFLGTAILVLAVFAVSQVLPISLFTGMAAGLVLGLTILTFGAISGAHINPAITVAFWTVRKIRTFKAITFIVAQVLGGFAAFYLIQYFVGKPVDSIAGEFTTKTLVAEAIGGLVFGFVLISAVYKKYEGGKLAFSAGTGLLVGIMIAASATVGINQFTQQPKNSNGIVNPAVAVGLNSVNWSYIAGPIIGTVVGMNLYALVFTEESIFSGRRKAVKVSQTKAKSGRTSKKPTAKSTKKRKK